MYLAKMIRPTSGNDKRRRYWALFCKKNTICLCSDSRFTSLPPASLGNKVQFAGWRGGQAQN